jgi:membrane protease YdiL (CAAX protease family)
MQNDKKAVKLFLIIVFAVSAVIEAVWIIFGEPATQAGISTLLMMVPFLVAIIIGRIFYKKQGALGFKRCKLVYILMAIFIPLVYFAPSYGLYWLFSKGSFTGNLSVLTKYATAYSGQELPEHIAIIVSLIVMLPITIITALGEEVGWRGFMYPVMQRVWGWKKAIIISGGVWALWHLPIVIAGLYYPSNTSLIYLIPVFVVEVFALTVIFTWLRMVSNSVLPVILLHAMHNYFDQIIFQSLTNDASSVYFVGEIGVITLSITVLVAVIILIKGRNAFTDKLEKLT